jgi:integrase
MAGKREKRKRGNNEGSIYQRADGKWCSALWTETGKRKVVYGRTREEVADKLALALADRAKGLPIAVEQQTVRQFLERWRTDTAAHRLRPGTYRRYHELIHLHALPTLGKLRLAKLTPQHLSQLYGAKLTAGLTPRTAQGLTPRTVEFLHRVLHAALKEAVMWGLIARNPADAVKAPKPKRPPIHPLDQEQAQKLLAAADGDPLEALYVLAVMVGMRQGELLGLQWADVDWASGRLQVCHTLQWGKRGAWSLEEPKTGHSRRSIRLPASALQALKAHKAKQAEQRLAVGPAWEDNDLVFANAVGRPIEPTNLLHRSYKRLLDRAGLPKIRFHDLRHTYATLALLNGEKPKVVQETLGHASITLTLDTYSHVLPDMQDDAAVRMEALLGRATGSY